MAATARTEVGFQTMEEYMRQRHNMVAQYIPTQSLLDLCGGSERAMKEHIGVCWREQGGINIAGAREGKETAEATEEERGKY